MASDGRALRFGPKGTLRVSGYSLLFVTESGDPGPRQELDGDSLVEAKFSAAIRYAGAAFGDTPPPGYMILCPEGQVVYIFPEVGG